jgi:TPR repeat protein
MDPRRALEYFKLAAEQDDPDAMFNYALFLLTGRGDGKKDHSLAQDLFRRAADEDHYPSIVNFGYCLATGTGRLRDLDNAACYFRIAAEWGDPVGQFNFGLCYYLGLGIQTNYKEAARYFGLSAEQDFAAGHSNLGFCLAMGRGVDMDLEAAVFHFERSADQGLAAGQFNLGFSLLKGSKADSVRGVQLLRQSWERGYTPAGITYSDCLLKGIGGMKDVLASIATLSRVGLSTAAEKCRTVQFIDTFCMTDNLIRPGGLDDMGDDRPSPLEIDFWSSLEVVDLEILHCGLLWQIKKMQHQATGQLMAVKLFSSQFQASKVKTTKEFIRELSGLRDLKHPCIMEMVGFQLPSDGNGAEIAYEFMKNGSLLDVLKRVQAGDAPPFWTPTGIATIVMGLVLGMRFIHSRQAIHRNLKPSNLFITDDGRLRIGDLTWCRFSIGKSELTKQPGSAHYQAPEIYESDKYDKKIDIFAFASVLYEILSLRPVFSPDLPPHRVMAKLVKRKWAGPPDDWSPPVRQLLNDCWRAKPDQRPSFSQIASFLAEYNFYILPGVDADAVRVFVDEVDRAVGVLQE